MASSLFNKKDVRYSHESGVLLCGVKELSGAGHFEKGLLRIIES